jgi:hypothetical protein
MRDRRQSERIPSILEGCLRLDPQAAHIPCTIRDLSVTGARIWLPGSVDLPGEFNLEIPVLEQAMPVRVMWSNGRNHGVMFLEALREPAGDDALALLQKLQAPDDRIERKAASERPVLPVQKQAARPATLRQKLWRLFGR